MRNFKFVDDYVAYKEDDAVDYVSLERSNLRCSICDCVSSTDIADEFAGNFTKATFVMDRRDRTKMICTECVSCIRDSLEEF